MQLCEAFRENQTLQMHGNFEEFPLIIICIVWVGNIMNPGDFPSS